MKRKDVAALTASNYNNSEPWPKRDIWHRYTFSAINQVVEQWLAKYAHKGMKVLNAGSGGTEYKNCRHMIHLGAVGLPDASVDGIVCVGSVLNYADAQRTIQEFSRILKPGGFLILEFERSNSAEFLLTKKHGAYIFPQKYSYNQQTHVLWMYSEKHIRDLFCLYHLHIQKCKRVHVMSSLLDRLGFSQETSAPYSRIDQYVSFLSYPLAHNAIFLGIKKYPSE